MILNTYTHNPKSAEPPSSIVFLLHGLGANGQDLISLASYWEDALPHTVFVSPDAPFPCDMAPFGYQWFSLQDWSPFSVLTGVGDAAPILERYIDEMLEHYNIPAQKAALVGFSQGTMMSLYVGPRRPEPLAGIVGYSGALVGGEGLLSPEIHKTPIHLVHGTADTVVPVHMYQMAKAALQMSGFPVSGHLTVGLGHSIDEEGIDSAARFLQERLGA